MRVVALIDGEHYPPVVSAALAELGATEEVVGVAFLGGSEKVESEGGFEVYGVPLVHEATPEMTVAAAIARFGADAVVDLSDEPVTSSALRFRLASIAMLRGVAYLGADFAFTPPSPMLRTRTPTLAVIGTGKRVGKTAVSAHVARHLKSAGLDVVVLAMGRGGPAEPEVIHGETVELTTADLLALAAKGVHAASDNYEDAVMSRVATVGTRRCGGGMAGATFFGNVLEGAELADGLGKQLLILEGSGAAIPPVGRDACLLVVGAGQGASYVLDYFGPYRVGLADAVVVAGAEEPFASARDVEDTRVAVASLRPDLPVVPVTFRPRPLGDISGLRVFFATTAPGIILPRLVEHLESVCGCRVATASPHLSDRTALRRDLVAAAGTYDVIVTELKAAAIDVAAAAAEEAGVPTVLCDNVPQAVEGDLEAMIDELADAALERGRARSG